MAQENTAKNGARAKILSTLAREGMLPVAEIALITNLTEKQVRDNSTMARAEGLITSERDDVTRLLAYKITSEGRKWVATHLVAEKLPAKKIEAQTPDEPAATHKESLTVPAPDPVWDIVDKIIAYDEILAEPIEIESEAADFEPVADQPEIDRPIYAVTSYNGGVEVVGDDLNLAIGRAVSYASGRETVVRVYQMVPIGETYTTVGFRHAAA